MCLNGSVNIILEAVLYIKGVRLAHIKGIIRISPIFRKNLNLFFCWFYFFLSRHFMGTQIRHLERTKNDVAKNLLHDNVYIVYCIRESEEDAFDDITTNTSSCVSFVVVCFHCQSFGCDGLCL